MTLPPPPGATPVTPGHPREAVRERFAIAARRGRWQPGPPFPMRNPARGPA